MFATSVVPPGTAARIDLEDAAEQRLDQFVEARPRLSIGQLAGTAASRREARTVAAIDVINDPAGRIRLAGAIVLIGGSAR